MLKRAWCRAVGHSFKTVATFPARQGKPPVVVLVCRCGVTASVPALVKS